MPDLRPARALTRAAAVAPLAAAVVAAVALPSAASPGGFAEAPSAQAAPASTTSETGTLVELVADDFARGVASTEWALQRSKASFVALEGVRAADVRGLVGKKVRVTGKALGRHAIALDGGSIAAAEGSDATQPTVEGTTSAATASKRVAVVMVNFADDPQQPFTAAQVEATLDASSADVEGHFGDSSDGAMSVTGDVFGWHTVSRTSAASCDYSAWGNAASSAVKAAGADLSGYDHVMYLWPQQSACSWAGLGQLPGTTTWINGSNTTRVIAHEVAHNLGEHHASAAGSCTEGGASVVIPSAISSCTVSEYGDPFTIMGSSSYYLHTGAARAHWGWLAPATAEAAAPGTWTLSPLDSGLGTRMVRIPRGDGTFLSLEYRQPNGFFDTFSTTAPVATGVTLRLDRGVGTKQTVLFDANPATATYGDAPLAAGRSVTDPLSGATVTVSSVSSTQAQVSVSYGGPGGTTDPNGPGTGTTTPPPPSDTTAPTSVSRLKAAVRKGDVTLSWRAATDDSGSVTYVVTRGDVSATTSTTSYKDAPGAGTWTYTVVARDAAGNTSAPAQVTASVSGAGAVKDGGRPAGKR